VMKQLMHEADHSLVSSAEVTHECSCNGASPVCLHCVRTDIFTFYHCFEGMTPVSTCTHFCPTENEGILSHVTMCDSTVLCCVKTQNVVI
jgi:hypothetical protein